MIECMDLKEGYSKMEVRKENENKYATRKDVAIATAAPIMTSVGLAAHQYFNGKASVEEPINVLAQIPIVEPSTVEAYTPIMVNAIPQQQGYIADKSLEMLATILDPVIDILVAISFPIASVIMVGACFFFMIGNSERAWSMIMNAGLGYVLIQLSPLFLEILRTVGEAVGN